MSTGHHFLETLLDPCSPRTAPRRRLTKPSNTPPVTDRLGESGKDVACAAARDRRGQCGFGRATVGSDGYGIVALGVEVGGEFGPLGAVTSPRPPSA